MGHMNPDGDEQMLLAGRAADWLRRLEGGDAQEQARFMAWLKESPRHVREILLMSTWDRVLENFDPQHSIDVEEYVREAAARPAGIVPLHEPVPAIAPRRPGSRLARRGFGLAAAAAACAVIWWYWPSPGQTYETVTGEQRAVELDDGSVVHLNTRSRVRVRYSPAIREVHLDDGQALFKVQHDPRRPFRVYAGKALIEVLGTEFDVQRRAERITVAVIEGRVQVEGGSGTEILSAGEEAQLAGAGRIARSAATDLAVTTAWRQRRLVFRKDTLADMAEAFNRYNRRPQIRIEGEQLRMRVFNGVFDADDPRSFLQFLDGVPDLIVRGDEDEVVVRQSHLLHRSTDTPAEE